MLPLMDKRSVNLLKIIFSFYLQTKEPIGWKLDPEEGDGLAPSPSEYYSPLETGESPENTMPFISPQHRYTDSSDSSNSKPGKINLKIIEDREHNL